MDTTFAQHILKALQPWFTTLQSLKQRPNAHALYDSKTVAGRVRMANLQLFLSQLLPWKPSVLLVGEAPGYRGAWRTGVNFCSEKIMLGPKDKFGCFGGLDAGYQRITDDPKIWGEASSTVAQRVFQELPEPVLVWPALPMHPHQVGEDESNRTPTPDELRRYAAPQLKQLIDIYKPAQIAAVGNIGQSTLAELGINAVKIRHPAHGGGPAFREGLLALIRDKT
jgi:hypothetical protein